MMCCSGEVRSPEDLKLYVKKDPSTGVHYCSICQAFSNRTSTCVRNHIEAKHFNNLFVYTCQLCGATLGTKTALNNHMARSHKKTKPDHNM